MTAANAGTVARICRRLDGLPLAIELAAARIKLFPPPKALLGRLDRGLELLAGGARDLPERQRTLRDTVAWSYDLLGADERLMFSRLAAFVGDFSLEAAETIRAPDAEGNFLDTLTSLVDNSLLVSRAETSSDGEGEEPRFAMLATIREYAVERLHSSGEAEQVRRAHALYYLALAEATQPEVVVPPPREWWTRLEEEHDNLRAALRRTIRSGEGDAAVRLALALWRFWSARHLGEGLRLLEAVLAMGGTAGAEPEKLARRRALLLLAAGILATRHGDYDRAVALDEASLAIFREDGPQKRHAWSAARTGGRGLPSGSLRTGGAPGRASPCDSQGVWQRPRLWPYHLQPGRRPERAGRSRQGQDAAGREPTALCSGIGPRDDRWLPCAVSRVSWLPSLILTEPR